MEKPEKITTAFLLNNDPKQVSKSFEKVFKLAERHQEEIYNGHACKMDLSQMYLFMNALKTVRKKVIKAFNASIEDKSPQDQQKQIIDLNRAFYFPDDD